MFYSKEMEDVKRDIRKSTLICEREALIKDLQAYCVKVINRVSFIDSELLDIRHQEIREEIEAEINNKKKKS